VPSGAWRNRSDELIQAVLQFTNARPAGTPARNDVIGGSCNGSTLRAGLGSTIRGVVGDVSVDGAVAPAERRGSTVPQLEL
jgi:hypothetical protein